MRLAARGSLAALGVVGLVAAGCTDFGYVELKTVPGSARPVLYIDGERVEPPRDGVAVLRQAVGARKLQSGSGPGQFSVLCEIVVRKDRITTVTVSVLERPPRCMCARPSGQDAQGRRTCIG
jgi:hypothetical protein